MGRIYLRVTRRNYSAARKMIRNARQLGIKTKIEAYGRWRRCNGTEVDASLEDVSVTEIRNKVVLMKVGLSQHMMAPVKGDSHLFITLEG